MANWRYCTGLIYRSSNLHTIHARHADKTGLCNWCRERLNKEPEKWKRVGEQSQ